MKNMNKLYWTIGKNIYKLKDKCLNPCEYISNYYSYSYGNSYKFNRENILYMKKFFMYYPIYIDRFDNLSWEHFKILLNLNNKIIRNFYLSIALFCNSSVEELDFIITNFTYFRI